MRLVRFAAFVLPGLILLASAEPSWSDVIILKDGYTLLGLVKREGETIFDTQSGQAVKVGKGFYTVDDDVRRTIFSFRMVLDDKNAVTDQNVIRAPDQVVLSNPLTPFSTAVRIDGIAFIQSQSPFDDNWYRVTRFVGSKLGQADTRQRLTTLTPHYARVGSSHYLWQPMYLTRELGPETVRQLLYTHPDLREKVGQVDPRKRVRIIRFLIQAGFYDTAEQEMELFLKDCPAEKEQLEGLQQNVQKLRVRETLDDLERAQKAGRHGWVRKHIEKVVAAGGEERQLAQARGLKLKYEIAEEGVSASRRLLKDLPARCEPEAHKNAFTEAAAVLLGELNIDNYERLERFVALGVQAERDRSKGQTPAQSASDLMGLAVSGWLLGNASAEPKAEAGLRFWRARRFVRAYQRTDEIVGRKALLADFEKNKTDAIAFDELAQLISLLPPSHPEARLAADLMELQTELPDGKRKRVKYYLQLPDEYHHSRSYPVLLVLHQSIEKSADSLRRWTELAQKHGYILVAPEWKGNDDDFRQTGGYGFTAEEQAFVLDTLRDLIRRFHVNSDRVFLAGAGQGGDMALDIGLSHPDLFAGVVTMGGQPRYFARTYASNGFTLPFYCVCGDLASDAPKAVRRQFETWVAGGFPSLYVEYKGRGQEWFEGELTYIFDWLNRKKRANAVPEITDCCSARTTDNRFYWLSADGIEENRINDAAKWRPNGSPATIRGKIADNNQIHLHVRGWKKITVWLGRGMIDFDKPVSVSVNTQSRWTNKKVTPNLGIMLEDFYQRGDRQRLFLARVELAGG